MSFATINCVPDDFNPIWNHLHLYNANGALVGANPNWNRPYAQPNLLPNP